MAHARIRPLGDVRARLRSASLPPPAARPESVMRLWELGGPALRDQELVTLSVSGLPSVAAAPFCLPRPLSPVHDAAPSPALTNTHTLSASLDTHTCSTHTPPASPLIHASASLQSICASDPTLLPSAEPIADASPTLPSTQSLLHEPAPAADDSFDLPALAPDQSLLYEVLDADVDPSPVRAALRSVVNTFADPRSPARFDGSTSVRVRPAEFGDEWLPLSALFVAPNPAPAPAAPKKKTHLALRRPSAAPAPARHARASTVGTAPRKPSAAGRGGENRTVRASSLTLARREAIAEKAKARKGSRVEGVWRS
jgi:hypothetical protein